MNSNEDDKKIWRPIFYIPNFFDLFSQIEEWLEINQSSVWSFKEQFEFGNELNYKWEK